MQTFKSQPKKTISEFSLKRRSHDESSPKDVGLIDEVIYFDFFPIAVILNIGFIDLVDFFFLQKIC